MEKPKLKAAEFTVGELSHFNNRLLDLLRGADWPSDRGMVYILFTIIHAQILDGITLEQGLDQYRAIWSSAVQFNEDKELSRNN